VIKASFEIDGIVEKPDVIGAVFGQTEGLLGAELDLRELQKSGRIGRIEVNVTIEGTKSKGEIIVPSSLDRFDTSSLAAALETVDRIGPCEAKIKVLSIEDTRNVKRDFVLSRAKDILKTMISEQTPESREISDKLRDDVKTADAIKFGPDQLDAGPEVETAEEIIVVEGRADVLSVLRAGIKNVICLQGKNIPQTVVDLSKKKKVTLFVDGDRGGDLIIKNFMSVGDVYYITKAPDGKEVEELTQKEILKCLKNAESVDEYMAHNREGGRRFERSEGGERRERGRYERRERGPPRERGGYERRERGSRGPPRGRGERGPQRGRGFGRGPPRGGGRGFGRGPRREYSDEPMRPPLSEPYAGELGKLEGSFKGVLLNKDNAIVAEANVRDLAAEMEKQNDIEAVVFDGIITQRLVDIANKRNIKHLVGVKQTQIENKGEVKIESKA